MNLDAEDLLTQIHRDHPAAYELSSLRLLVERQAEALELKDAEIERLTALLPATTTTYSTAGARPYVGSGLPDEGEPGRHGG